VKIKHPEIVPTWGLKKLRLLKKTIKLFLGKNKNT
jgi:hypothetical protein